MYASVTHFFGSRLLRNQFRLSIIYKGFPKVMENENIRQTNTKSSTLSQRLRIILFLSN
jgi:hypothetical protein